MIHKIFSLALGTMLFALCFPAEAQQPKKVPRIGFVSAIGDPQTPGFQIEEFRAGLRNLGYVEGKSLLIEYRYAEGKPDRIPSLVAELVQLKVEVLVVGAQASIRAAMQATKTIPIVMVSSVDPVAAGIVDSLARPGGNITGLSRLTRELGGKRLEIIKEVVPEISRVGILRVADDPASTIAFKEYEAAASALKIQLQSLEMQRPTPYFTSAFQTASNRLHGRLL